jgi:hypothetical protein
LVSARPRTEVHGFRQLLVVGPRQHAAAQVRVGLFTFVDASALPVREVMVLATVAPLDPVIERAVREETAAVTGKGKKTAV